MAYPDLPNAVKRMLASAAMRQHHRIWHAVRRKSTWNGLTPTQRQQLAAAGWQPPRFESDPGAGIDFLGMHREMIAHVNQAFSTVADPNWQRVTGWNPIPWRSDDADWPVPNWTGAPAAAVDARSAARVQQMKTLAETQFQRQSWLTTISLDRLGDEIEWTIHGWMHMRWSAPPFADPNSVDPANDWLFDPWSSHVNKTFWKLHGWIDDRIGDWERANHATADLSQAWSGPPTMHHMEEAPSASVAERDLPNFKPMRFRFSQARVDKLLGQGKPKAKQPSKTSRSKPKKALRTRKRK